MSDLAGKKCVPCRGGASKLTSEQINMLLQQLPQWKLADGKQITRTFRFPDFAKALAFVNRVGEVAEEQGHHPDILLSWGKADISLSTHDAGGLSENDFIVAAKIDQL